jgi:hypothetical protein
MEVNKMEETKVVITTSVPFEWKERAKLTGLKLNHIFGLGLKAAEENPQFIERIKLLEKEVENKDSHLSRQNNVMQQVIFKLQEENTSILDRLNKLEDYNKPKD